MKTKIIGTTHLDSAAKIEGILKDENPDVIGIELCDFRVKLILDQVKLENTKQDDSLLGKITSKIKEKAEKSGMDYGSDMQTALRYARNNKIPYVLVDMPILKIQELFMKIPKNEQEGFARELQEFESQSISTKVDENEVIETLKSRYPIAFEFLVNMRNLYIANQILIAERKYPNKKIVVILGSAHANNVNKMIQGG